MNINDLKKLRDMLKVSNDDKVTIDINVMSALLNASITLIEEVSSSDTSVVNGEESSPVVEEVPVIKVDSIFSNGSLFHDEVVDGVNYIGIGNLVKNPTLKSEVLIDTVELVGLYNENKLRENKTKDLTKVINNLTNELKVYQFKNYTTSSSSKNTCIEKYKVILNS